MKKLLMAIAVLSVGLFSSCDKCKDADCKNGATCEKKVGDCNCPTFYNGTKCDGEVRSNYVGTYIGTSTTVFTVQGQTITETETDTMEVITNGTTVTKLDIKGDGTSDDPNVPLVLSNNTDFTATTSFTENGTLINATGSGKFTSTTLSLNATLSGDFSGQPITGALSFTGTKQ